MSIYFFRISSLSYLACNRSRQIMENANYSEGDLLKATGRDVYLVAYPKAGKSRLAGDFQMIRRL